MKLGERISKRRKEKGISQEQLAEIMHVSRQSVSLWENDQTIPSMEKLLQLSEVLNISMNVLAGNELSLEENGLPIASAKTQISTKVIEESINAALKKMKKTMFFLTVAFGILALIILSNTYPDKYVILAIIVVAELAFGLRLYFTEKKLKTSAMRNYHHDPDREYGFEFYTGHVNITVKSQKTDSKSKLDLQDFDNVIETENYFFLFNSHGYYPVAKSGLQGNLASLRLLFRNSARRFESPVEKTDNRSSEMSFKHAKTLKILSSVLFILSFFTLPLALAILSTYSQLGSNYSFMDTVEKMWVMLFVLPLPVSSIVIGLILKKHAMKGTKNIVIGIIMSGLVLIYSSFTLIFGAYLSHDYGYVDSLEVTIDFELPDQGRITTDNFGVGSNSNGKISGSTSDVLFLDSNEITDFESRMKTSNLWTQTINTQNMGMLSDEARIYDTYYDYYMIYNVDLDTYNALPASTGTYHMIFIGYSLKDNTMKIIEYQISLSIN